MAEGPSTKLRHVTNTICGGMIIVCRILQNEPERSFAKALKKNTLLLMREYVLFTSVNVALHRLVCCRLTFYKTAFSVFNANISCHLIE